jgi:hypothetical protein
LQNKNPSVPCPHNDSTFYLKTVFEKKCVSDFQTG